MEPTVLRMHEGLERWESLNVPDKLALEELMMETSNELYKLKTDVLKISSE
jgi:hypothetical protein